MLLNMHVKNIALIDDVDIDFEKGLNILTGETGAGKSLIIDSVNFALGKRMPKNVVRDDADYALCELIFSIDSDEVGEKLKELMIPASDEQVVIQRRLKDGRSIIRVNGESASASQLKELAGVLIDIHGQHEHQSLLYNSKHKQILDSYCGNDLAVILPELSSLYHEYVSLCHEHEEAEKNDGRRDRETELARFEVDEIQKADIKEGEIESLEAEYRRLSNAKRIAEAVGYAHRNSGYEDEASAGLLVGRALKSLQSVAEYDDSLMQFVNELSDIDSLLNDFNRSLATYEEELDSWQEKFGEVEERLNTVNHIRDRYGDTKAKIDSYLKKQQELIAKFSDYEAYIRGLDERIGRIHKELIALCAKASDIRKREALLLEKSIKDALKDLNFLDVRFEVCVSSDEERLTETGYDTVEFLISTNPGQKIRPLSDVASGGELSRIMLALKSVLADKDCVGTLIFDEIDTGISGRTAQKVSEKLKSLSKERQVICITHLPQIAAMADEHFCISKRVDMDRTFTEVSRLDEDSSVHELARMLGGVKITDNVIENAKEMKMLANRID